MTEWNRMQLRNRCLFMALLIGALLPPSLFCGNRTPSREEGRLDIYVAGKEIGQEKFAIEYSSDSISSSSTISFRDPGGQHESVQIQTQLKMDSQYVPQTYQVRTLIGGRRQAMKCTLVPDQSTLECQRDNVPGKSGLLVGNRYIVLDANVFHHFIFVGKLFNFSGAGKTQSLEAAIPQEMDDGNLTIIDVGIENVSLRGKNRELHHLKIDSGSLMIDLWIDDAHVLYKIALPAKRIEVIRNF
jgi:hypothetical protein